MDRGRLHIALIALIGLGMVAAAVERSPSAHATTTTFATAGDTFVASDQPSANFGTSAKIYTDGSPQRRLYLHFVVSGLGAGVTAAGGTLKVYANSASTTGVDVATMSGTWSETATTWSNDTTTRSTPVATSGPISAGSWVSITLPSSLRMGDGVHDFALLPRDGTAISFASREAGNAAQLLLTTAATAPAPTTAPVVNDVDYSTASTVSDGDLLQTSSGTWSTDATYSYRWQRCQAASCADIPGATAQTYRVGSTGSDAGFTLRSVVTATNAAGAASAASGATQTVQTAAPRNTVAPTVSGTAAVGSALNATPGTWYGTPTVSLRYQWLRCGSTCSAISGATSTTYTVQQADSGSTLKVSVTASNGEGSKTATSTPTASVGSSASYPTIAAAGDIACDPAASTFNGGAGGKTSCDEKAVSDLLVNKGYSAVLSLGDNQYYCGSLPAFQHSYDPSWGRVKSITHPAVGNHEYLTSTSSTGSTGCDSTNAGAAGYWKYFGTAANPLGTAAKGWYSFDVGSWHLIALNSTCSSAGGCGTTSPQGKWLTSDLAAHANQCTLAYWHIPLFSSGGRANSGTQQLWTMLYNAGVDVVLNGHDHIYERFGPQNPTGGADSTRGIREFIVGTGGANHTGIAAVAANSQVRDTSTFGVLQLTLKNGSYDWKFNPAVGTGSFTDSGSGSCH